MKHQAGCIYISAENTDIHVRTHAHTRRGWKNKRGGIAEHKGRDQGKQQQRGEICVQTTQRCDEGENEEEDLKMMKIVARC